MRKNAFSVSKPEDQGVKSDAIKSAISQIREANKLDLHSFLMLRNGSFIWEEYFRENEADRLHVLFSVTKSFMSTAIGMAQEQGLLSLDDTIMSFFPEYKDVINSANDKDVTLRHLLMMGSGYKNDELNMQMEYDSVKAGLSQPIIHEPGTVFDYYTLGSHLLSAAFNKVYPEGMHKYLRKYLFTPMGFGESNWNVDFMNITLGGYGLYLTAYDMARFGQLYLQKGVWEGLQLVPESYVCDATSKQICNKLPQIVEDGKDSEPERPDWSAGYGYQFWQNSFGGFRADGMMGQFIIVLPEPDSVIVMTSNLDEMHVVMKVIKDNLLPHIS